MIDASRAVQARRRHRRRAARPRGGLRARSAAWTSPSCTSADADGAAARRVGRRAAEALARGARAQVRDAGADGRDLGRASACAASGSPTAREVPADLVVMAVGIRPNTALAKASGIACDRGMLVNDTMQTYDPRIYARRRVRAAPRRVLRPRRAAVRAGEGRREPPRPVRHRPLRGLADLDQAQGHRHRPVLGRRLHGRRRHRGARVQGRGARRLQEARRQGRQASGRRALRRHRRRRVVLPAPARRHGDQRLPREPAVRPGAHRRLRHGRRRRRHAAWPTRPRSAAATASARATSSRRSRRRACSRSTRCARTPRRRRRAARARAWSSSCSRTRSAATTRKRRRRSRCAPARSTRTRKCAPRSCASS